MSEKGIHTYSSPKGEKFFLDAIAERMKKRFNVELDPNTEICSLIGSKEGLANFIRIIINGLWAETCYVHRHRWTLESRNVNR